MVRIALEAKLGVDAGNKHYDLASSGTEVARSNVQSAVSAAGVATATAEQQSAPRLASDDGDGLYL
jgi:hypothetical protein